MESVCSLMTDISCADLSYWVHVPTCALSRAKEDSGSGDGARPNRLQTIDALGSSSQLPLVKKTGGRTHVFVAPHILIFATLLKLRTDNLTFTLTHGNFNCSSSHLHGSSTHALTGVPATFSTGVAVSSLPATQVCLQSTAADLAIALVVITFSGGVFFSPMMSRLTPVLSVLAVLAAQGECAITRQHSAVTPARGGFIAIASICR